MAIAVIATLIRIRDTASINWILIVAGLAIGVILGAPGQEDQDDGDAAAGRLVQRCGRRYRRAHRLGGIH
jgi:hypothetical protein